MNSVISYLDQLPDQFRIWLLVLSLVVFAIVELGLGFPRKFSYLKHYLQNALFVVTAFPIQLLFGAVFLFLFHWDKSHQWGIFQSDFFQQHPWLLLLTCLIYLDFCEYWYHVFMHQFKRLWMFHAIHHSDMDVNTSTTLREHPGETMIRMSFLVLVVFSVGIPFWAFVFRQCIQIVFNVFAHSSFRLNERMDRICSQIFITPNMHHVHHHDQEPLTNTNYGDIFSVWDRLFGTFASVDSHAKISFGLDSFPDTEENNHFGKLLKIPFGKYRPKPERIEKE